MLLLVLLVTVLCAARFVIHWIGLALAVQVRIRKTGRAGCLSRWCSLGCLRCAVPACAVADAQRLAC